jgi:hypothetical protein
MRYKTFLNPTSIKTIQNVHGVDLLGVRADNTKCAYFATSEILRNNTKCALLYPPIQRAFRPGAGLKHRNQGLQSVAKQTGNPQTGQSGTTFLV